MATFCKKFIVSSEYNVCMDAFIGRNRLSTLKSPVCIPSPLNKSH